MISRYIKLYNNHYKLSFEIEFMAKKRLQFYVASPYGFYEACRTFMNKTLLHQIRRVGIPVNPWELTDQIEIDSVLSLPDGKRKLAALHTLDMTIGKRNQSAIRACDGIVAVLDGSDVDSGVAAEVGYGSALGKPILGYRNDFRLASENLGTKVNLQVQYFIEETGGKIVQDVYQIPDALRELFLID